jgi:ubiquinone/menaquinone biosynthesis C-methylase UbiE
MDKDLLKTNIGATFDDVSKRYDENKFFAISAKRMAELIPSFETMKVLDISTGTGAVAIEIARRYPHADVEGIDFSSGMLEQARNKTEREGLGNIKFQQCDVEKMTYGDKVFNAVTCGYALFFFPDMEETYQAIVRTIKPGGLFVFSSFTHDAFNPYAELLLERLESEYNIEVPSRLRERLKTKRQIEELAAVCQCKSVRIEHHPIRYFITISEWWSLLNNAGYKSLLDQLSTEQLSCLERDHLSEVESISSDGVLTLNADTLFGLVTV